MYMYTISIFIMDCFLFLVKAVVNSAKAKPIQERFAHLASNVVMFLLYFLLKHIPWHIAAVYSFCSLIYKCYV